MIVRPPAAASVTGHAAQLYADDLRADGFVYAHTAAMAINSEAHAAFEELIRAVVPSIGMRTYELVTLAAARGIGSAHCLLAHGRTALQAGVVDETQLEQLATDPAAAGLGAAETAAMAYAEKLSTDAAAMTDADSAALRAHGYTDRQIVDITLAAAARNLFSRSLQALAVPVDDVPGLPARTAAALVDSTRRPRVVKPRRPAPALPSVGGTEKEAADD